MIILLVIVVVTALIYCSLVTRSRRNAFKNLPQPPDHHRVFGHLGFMGTLVNSLPDRLHPQIYPLIIHEKYNLGKAFYVDLWPISPSWLMIRDPELADQVVIKPSLPKFYGLKDLLSPYAGERSLVVQEGTLWKHWRTLFNPAFSTTALREHVRDLTVDCEHFKEKLRSYSAAGMTVELESAAVEVTVQIIGRIILGPSFANSPHGKRYTKVLRDQAYWVAAVSQPVVGQLRRLDPWRALMMKRNEAYMNKTIRSVVQERWKTYAEHSDLKGSAQRQSAIDLALDSFIKNETANKSNRGDLEEEFLSILVDQLKTFLFAGHDTSSGTLCYIFWLLHQNPAWLTKLRNEYTEIFGESCEIARKVSEKPSLLSDLPVTAAVIKETLRLFPPASSVRSGTPDKPLVDPETGETYPTDGYMVMVASFALQRNELYFPHPHAFRPERWLGNHHAGNDCEPLPEAERQHKHAYRPFEVGQRNCLGQELALMELKLIMALIIPQFDLVPNYQEKGWEQFRYLGAPAYPILLGTGKPHGGMPVRVYERS